MAKQSESSALQYWNIESSIKTYVNFYRRVMMTHTLYSKILNHYTIAYVCYMWFMCCLCISYIFQSSLTFIYERTVLDTINYANPINLYVYNLLTECASFETLLFYILFEATQQTLFLNKNFRLKFETLEFYELFFFTSVFAFISSTCNYYFNSIPIYFEINSAT